MKWRYLSVALVIVSLLYLANTNPEKGDYTAWASKQFMERTAIHSTLAEAEKQDSVIGDLAAFGKSITEQVVEPQVGLMIDKHTKQQDYLFFSFYQTEFAVGTTQYKYETIGIADRFVLLEAPQQTTKKEP
ncbi:DUF4359 domain-containing protein [Ectobacillus antri]|uniref:DUF4359 domain-containing protein n=1 Tax=Ectobacillus antri TaxID=2486280 RepID=A0ABT6HB48_9BACI|nr:DUF4359 domain-containing protein [Ectobacillus antri]MDG4658567.1 DUF4359 domain-containing protein [Ectobacillus antri]MDG5755571.1 DUF4359 domain-containing protein [Ectobacillus antri]